MKSSTNKNNFLPASFTVFCMMHFFIGTVVILSTLTGQSLTKGMAAISLFLWMMEALAIFFFVCAKLGEDDNDKNL